MTDCGDHPDSSAEAQGSCLLHPCKVYIASLPTNYGEDKLRKLFEQFGALESVRFVRGTRAYNGYGFALYRNSDDASRAIQGLMDFAVEGSRVQVRRARVGPPTAPTAAPASNGAGAAHGNTTSASKQHPPRYPGPAAVAAPGVTAAPPGMMAFATPQSAQAQTLAFPPGTTMTYVATTTGDGLVSLIPAMTTAPQPAVASTTAYFLDATTGELRPVPAGMMMGAGATRGPVQQAMQFVSLPLPGMTVPGGGQAFIPSAGGPSVAMAAASFSENGSSIGGGGSGSSTAWGGAASLTPNLLMQRVAMVSGGFDFEAFGQQQPAMHFSVGGQQQPQQPAMHFGGFPLGAGGEMFGQHN